jgi:hypothetical protein
LDKLYIYDRALDNTSIYRLYNRGFTNDVKQNVPNFQRLYPESDITAEGINYLLYTSHSGEWPLDKYDGNGGDNNLNIGYPYQSGTGSVLPSRSGEFFSAINEWHSHFSSASSYIDDTVISHRGSGTLEFGLGPIQIVPSSIDVHFVAREDGSGVIERAEIGGFTVYDKQNEVIAQSDTNIILSGKQWYTESLTLNEGVFDYSDTSIGFLMNSGMRFPTVPTYSELFSLSVSVSGDIGIANTGLDLYTTASFVDNSGIDLYATALDSGVQSIDLYTISVGVQESSIPLYTIAGIENSGMDLYTFASDSIAGGQPYYISGLGVDNQGIDLFIHGHLSDNSGIDFYTGGHIAVNSGMDLYTVGANIGNAAMPMFVQATVYDQSGSLPFSMWSTTNSGKFSTIPMYLGVSDNSGSYTTMPMYLETENTGSGTTYMPMFVMSDNQENKSLEIFLQNSYTSGHDSVNLFAQGLGGLDGGLPVNDSMPLFIARDSEGDSWGVPMYLQTNSGENQSLNLFISGGTWSNKAVNLVIPSTYGPDNSGITFQVNGY